MDIFYSLFWMSVGKRANMFIQVKIVISFELQLSANIEISLRIQRESLKKWHHTKPDDDILTKNKR